MAYGWFAPEYSIINRQNIDFVIYNQAKNDSYELLGSSVWTGWNVRFKQLGEFELDLRYNNEILLTDDDLISLERFIYLRVNMKPIELGQTMRPMKAINLALNSEPNTEDCMMEQALNFK